MKHLSMFGLLFLASLAEFKDSYKQHVQTAMADRTTIYLPWLPRY